jgi:RNA polymerase sigma factor (sigma-70 family)
VDHARCARCPVAGSASGSIIASARITRFASLVHLSVDAVTPGRRYGVAVMTVEALRSRRPEVLDELLERYGREIQGVAYLILRDREGAEDVVVDTLVAALEQGGQLRDPDALRAWLLRIATNRALQTRRTAARVVQLHLVAEGPAPGRDEDERLTLLACVDRLAPRMRAAVVLRYYADLSIRQVADALGTSENTVKTQLREALGQMRRTLAAPEPVEEAIGG